MHLYEYLGFALIQMPEALLSMYMYMKKYLDIHVTKEKPVDTKELNMKNQNSIVTTQLEKFSFTRTHSHQYSSYENNDGHFEGIKHNSDDVCKIKEDLEAMAIRMDEMEK